MNYQQKSCIKLLDELVERGVDITNLGKELPKNEYHRVRKRMYRAFGTGENALKAFGLYDINGEPSDYELYRCFYIDDNYEVKENAHEISLVSDIYYLNELDFRRLYRPILKEVRRDALDEFYRNEFPDKIKSTIIESDEFSHIWNYIRQIYGNIGNFMDAYGTPLYIFVDYNYDKYNGEAIKDGHTFEVVAEDVLKAIYANIQCQVSFEGCRPDFVLGDKWLDAKLSRHSPFHPRSTMLERYLKHTDDLTIIYARDKREPYTQENVKFVHISEYYPELEKLGRRELIDRCESFLAYLDESEAIS